VDVWLDSLVLGSPSVTDLVVFSVGFQGAGFGWTGGQPDTLAEANSAFHSLPLLVAGDLGLAWQDPATVQHTPTSVGARKLPLLRPQGGGAAVVWAGTSGAGGPTTVNIKTVWRLMPRGVRPCGIA
jgi:hypothetical protein